MIYNCFKITICTVQLVPDITFLIFFTHIKYAGEEKQPFFGKCSASSPKECERFSNSENFWILKMKL